ncbi:MAG TPA: efflux RND transporter periplasmic adaptor subunit, partial [Blastocatellia bacterium]|nr:efflux RND transporter periplasmic adaptor subunit [Blastocatellia bacterium]
MSTESIEGIVQISPEKQQLIGVTYGVVGYESVSKTIRAVGRVAYDETRISHVHTKYEGWIEEVFVDFVGKEVKQGQPLLSIYSPDLLQSQQEYLLAIRGRRELAESSFNEAAAGADSLYEAARRRLELWDMTDEQIAQLEKTGRPIKAVPVYAPASGFVLARNAYIRQRVTPDTELYSIADLSTVWVIADIYEYEAVEVSVGQQATVTLAYLPGLAFKGKVTYIYPQVDPATRTLKARIEVANPGYRLKPEMFANVELSVSYGKRLDVPQEAVMDSGSEQIVFVALDGGYFEPRRVRLGTKAGDKYIVLGGLRPGERIVTS